MNQLTQTSDHERYRHCATTTLDTPALVEIGRVMAHHGLLVARVREFVTFVASRSQGLPASIGSKESIVLLPTVMEAVKPAFSSEERYVIQDVLEQVATAEEAIDRFHYSSWGTLDGVHIVRNEYRDYNGLGCCADRTIYATNDLYNLAMEISVALKSIGKAQALLQAKLAEDPRLGNRWRRTMLRHAKKDAGD